MVLEKKKSPEKKLDLRKLGEDFADMALQGKFPEILILAKQIDISPREISEAFDQAFYILRDHRKDQLHKIGAAAGAVLGATYSGAAGMLIGAGGGMSAGIALSALRQGGIDTKIEKLVEAKKWLEEHN